AASPLPSRWRRAKANVVTDTAPSYTPCSPAKATTHRRQGARNLTREMQTRTNSAHRALQATCAGKRSHVSPFVVQPQRHCRVCVRAVPNNPEEMRCEQRTTLGEPPATVRALGPTERYVVSVSRALSS